MLSFGELFQRSASGAASAQSYSCGAVGPAMLTELPPSTSVAVAVQVRAVIVPRIGSYRDIANDWAVLPTMTTTSDVLAP